MFMSLVGFGAKELATTGPNLFHRLMFSRN